jgi:glutamate/tyrosine decarboxylase-like PLP-dependent enzyme
LARSLAGLLRRELDFELIGPNTLGVCNFRWVPRQRDGSPRFTAGKIDQLNRDLQELVEQEGDAWFSHTILKGRVALRVNVENRRMEMTDIERLVRLLKRTAQRILQERDHTTLSRSNDVTS